MTCSRGGTVLMPNHNKSVDPRRWFSHFASSFNIPSMRKRKVWPTDVDVLIHNRRTGKVLVLEGKPSEWSPSAYDGQLEALRALLSIRCAVYLVKADWPQGATSPVMTADEALQATPPTTVEIADVRGWQRGKVNGLEWRTLNYEEFLSWVAKGWD